MTVLLAARPGFACLGTVGVGKHRGRTCAQTYAEIVPPRPPIGLVLPCSWHPFHSLCYCHGVKEPNGGHGRTEIGPPSAFLQVTGANGVTKTGDTWCFRNIS